MKAVSPIVIQEQAAAPSAVTGATVLYVLADGKVYSKDEAGSVFDLTATGSGGSTPRTASIAFTDGDTLKRVTITDALVTSSSVIVATIRRPDTVDDSADFGYLYTVNVVKVATGSFDVLIACTDGGFGDPVEVPPNETITLAYFST